MKLQQLIDKLETLKSEHGSEIEVDFTIPAHEGSYESDYGATELTESEVFDLKWKGTTETVLSLTFQ